MSQQSPVRNVLALMASALLGLIMVWAGLIAALTILQQVLAGFFDLSQATWTSFLNPMVWFGLESLGGTGGVLDALIGGPGAPGGTMNRYFTFMLFAALCALCLTGMKAAWNWAHPPEART